MIWGRLLEYFHIRISLIEMQKGVAEIQHSLRPSQWVLLLCGFPAAFHTNALLVSDAQPRFGALL